MFAFGTLARFDPEVLGLELNRPVILFPDQLLLTPCYAPVNSLFRFHHFDQIRHESTRKQRVR